MFRASRNWSTISKVMVKMANHISILAQERNSGRTGVRLVGDDGVLVDDYDTILRELFCVTADALATKTKETLKNVGTLWDEIFVTGETLSKHGDKFSLHSLAEKGFQPNILQEYGRGCLMFLVRKVDSKRDVERLEAAGYRFAEVHQVVSSIRSSMHIKTPDLESRLRNMSNQKDKTTLLTPGVHVGMFAVRARLDRTGFDVLAQKTAKNLLPSVSLPINTLEPAHLAFLRTLHGLTLAAILIKIEKQLHFNSTQEKAFATSLREAISALRDFLGDEAFDDATLLPKEVQLPCASKKESKTLSNCTLVAFQLILPIHASPLAPQCEFTPLNFFKMRQLTYEGSSHHIEFSHMVHRDISAALHDVSARRMSVPPPRDPINYLSKAVDAVREKLPGHRRHATTSSTLSRPKSSQEQLSKVASEPSSLYNGDDDSFDDTRKSSTTSHVSMMELETTTQKSSPNSPFHVFGGIMVSQEVSINVQEVSSIPPSVAQRLDKKKKKTLTHPFSQTQADIDAPAGKGSEMVTLRPRADTQGKIEHFYSATASGDSTDGSQGKQHEAAFVDELLSLSMQADKRAAP